jgi:ABC-2 type transport system permease protein
VVYGAATVFLPSHFGASAQQQGTQISSNAFLGILSTINALLLPIIAIVMAYASVAGERDSGSIKLLLSLPHSRLDVVVGKVVGRSVVVIVPVLIGFAIAAVSFVLTPIVFVPERFVAFTLLTALLGTIFVALAVGISAAARSARQAMIGTVAVYVITLPPIWNGLATPLARRLRDAFGLTGLETIKLELFSKVLNPVVAYSSLSTALNVPETVTMGNSTVSGTAIARAQLAGGAGLQGQFNRQIYAQSLAGNVPFYLTDAFLVVLMVAIGVVVLAVGYWIFENTDL